MNDSSESIGLKGLREWWRSPPRTGLQRYIAPYEYRHLRAFSAIRFGGAGVAAAAGAICLGYKAYGWAAFFAAIAAANTGAAAWELSIARSGAART